MTGHPARVQAKVGYYVWVNEAARELSARHRKDTTDETDVINGAAAASFDAAEIGIRGAFSPIPDQPGADHFAIRIDPGDLRLVKEGDKYTVICGLWWSPTQWTEPSKLAFHTARSPTDSRRTHESVERRHPTGTGRDLWKDCR